MTRVPSVALSPPLSRCAPSQLSAMPSSCPPAVGLPRWLNSHLENALRFAPGHRALFPLLCRSFRGFAEGSCQPTPQTQRGSAAGSSSWRTPHPRGGCETCCPSRRLQSWSGWFWVSGRVSRGSTGPVGAGLGAGKANTRGSWAGSAARPPASPSWGFLRRRGHRGGACVWRAEHKAAGDGCQMMPPSKLVCLFLFCWCIVAEAVSVLLL